MEHRGLVVQKRKSNNNNIIGRDIQLYTACNRVPTFLYIFRILRFSFTWICCLHYKVMARPVLKHQPKFNLSVSKTIDVFHM